MRRAILRLVGTLVAIAGASAPAAAQTVEIAPFGGYRFGGDLFEVAASQNLDLDGAPVAGLAVNVAMWNGLWFEALASHQWADIEIRRHTFASPVRVRAMVNQFLAGGHQDFGGRAARPFVTGLVGLTHYAADGDDEIRFAISGGGGVRLFPDQPVGLRLEGRVFTTFVDVDAAGVCSGGCIGVVDVNVAWQAEFTAGFVVSF